MFCSLLEAGTALHGVKMSRKPKSQKTDNVHNDSRNGRQALMNSGHHNTVKSQVDFIYGAVPSRSKNDILLVLQSCDYNVESAISVFSQGGADDILSQWSHKGKKPKDGNKKKRNKKKPDSMNAQDLKPQKENEPLAAVGGQASDIRNSLASEPVKPKVPTELKLSVDPPEISLYDGISTPSPNSTCGSEPATPSEEPNKLPSKHKDHHPSLHHKTNKQHHHPKAEKLSPTTGVDALKKTTKDLTRSSFSLGRYHLLVEEECELSFKRITKTFQNIRNCIVEREATLNNDMKEFKEEAAKLLQQRSEDAAALKLKTERVYIMTEEQISLLRTDIRGFVAERKIDEELAQTKRFIFDEDTLLQRIKTFGEIIPIKSTYTPVVLNHPTPSITPKPTSTKTIPANDLSSTKPSGKSRPINVENKSEPSVVPKNPEPTPSLPRHRNTGTNGRPPNIDFLISSAMAKSSIAAGNLQDAAEIHSKLKEALKHQGIVKQNEVKKEHQNQEHRQPRRRPTTGIHPSGTHPSEPRPHRAQSSRQGNRSYQKPNRDEKSTELNKTSRTEEVRTKANQRGPYGRNETGKEGSDGGHKSTDGRQSNSQREGENRRSPQRRTRAGKANKAKINGEEPALDAPVASGEKESVLDGKDVPTDNGRAEHTPNDDVEKHAESIDKTTVETNSTDGALPQRRNQNRRKFMGREKEDTQEPGEQQINGETNCLVDNHTTDEEEKAEEILTKEDKIAKLTPVAAQPIINGHSEAHENAEKTANHESHENNTEEENIQVNGLDTSNRNGDDCIVER